MVHNGSLFQSKWVLGAVLAGCIFEVIVSERSLGTPPSSLHDAVHIYGLVACVGIFTALGLRCRATRERLLFGAMAFAMLLLASLAVRSPAQPATDITRWVVFVLWIASAALAFSILLYPSSR